MKDNHIKVGQKLVIG
ncbi:MAG: hypothetical protein HC926_03570 [Synechococcaceae cyanobacterium SM2_3_60]|nr:hypothetical protein [Synechococcaceae cyanobacterium SM2_3_60]